LPFRAVCDEIHRRLGPAGGSRLFGPSLLQLKIGKMGPEFGGKVDEMLWGVLGTISYGQQPWIGPEF
jgi:hypothetical protein